MIIKLRDIVKVILFAIVINVLFFGQLFFYLKYKRHAEAIGTSIIINQEATTERGSSTAPNKRQPINH